MTKKQVVKVIAFCLIAFIMTASLCDLFDYENTKNFSRRFYTYTQLEKYTIDAVYIGTSGVDRFWIGAKAYEEYGMTVYPLSTDSMPTWLYTSVMDYAFKYQNPELIILDLRAFCKDDSIANMDVRARRVLDSMEFGSAPFIKAAFRTMEERHKFDNNEPEFDISYLLSIVKYHSKWKEDDLPFADNIKKHNNEYAGFYMNKKYTTKVSPQTPVPYDSTIIEKIDPSCENSFYEIVEYSKEKNVKLLFVDTPQFKSDRELHRTNYMRQLIKKENLDFITWDYVDANGNLAFNLDLDFSKDFYNSGHVNFWGAEKFTDEFAQYLFSKYEFEDRRKDITCKEYWNGRYDIIKTKVEDYAQLN